MIKVIALSLWGNNPKYVIGALQNIRLAQTIYPDWQVWLYLPGLPIHPIVSQASAKNLIMHLEPEGFEGWKGMFARFQPAFHPDVDVMISRDCDSRLSLREKAAVDEWLVSDKGFHIMRDHPWHGSQILGGMFGIKKNCLPEFETLMQAWNQEDRWQTDQDFLNAVIYPRVVNNSMVHASFLRMEPHARDFPSPRSGLEFVGQVFDENEVTVAEHLTALAKAL